MTAIRVLSFGPKKLEGEGGNGVDVEDIEGFRDWVKRYGKAFTHHPGAGALGDVVVYAWKERPNEWLPVADATVLSSRKGREKGRVEITTDAVRIYPGEVSPLRVAKEGDRIIKLTSTRYGNLIARAYRD